MKNQKTKIIEYKGINFSIRLAPDIFDGKWLVQGPFFIGAFNTKRECRALAKREIDIKVICIK